MGEIEALNRDEPLGLRLQHHAYARLIAFSDGVFAFAATLLALDVHVPPGWRGDVAALVTADSVTKLIGYIVSYMVVGIYWMGNRRILAVFTRVDGTASLLCLAVLMLIALLPSVSQTLLIGGHFTDAVFFYVGYVTLIGWVQGALWAYGAFLAGLTHPDVDRRYKWASLIWMMVVPTTASGLTIYATRVSATYGYLGAFVVMGGMVALRRFAIRAPGEGARR